LEKSESLVRHSKLLYIGGGLYGIPYSWSICFL